MKKVIVLIGKISCGKDYAWEFLARKCAGKVLGISSSLRILAKQRNIQENRENLIALGKEVAEKYGDGYLAEILVQNAPEDLLIITWPRQLGQLEYLRKNTQSYFIAIESDEKIRYIRMKERWKIGEDISFEKFCELEKMEESTVQKVGECMKQADSRIENNGTIEEFEKKLEEIPFILSLLPQKY